MKEFRDTGREHMSAQKNTARRWAPARPSRRTFVKGLALGGVVAAFDMWRGTAWAQPAIAPRAAVLTGSDFDLRVGEALVNFTGSPEVAHAVNGSLPAPTLRWREGDTVTLRVSNGLRDHHASIHWHGILLPANI
jgi:FtsP/CotA-like multicopper oxidase with cupredoxin domain